jgi:hypothetical protein
MKAGLRTIFCQVPPCRNISVDFGLKKIIGFIFPGKVFHGDSGGARCNSRDLSVIFKIL